MGSIIFNEEDFETDHYYMLTQILPDNPEEGITYDKRIFIETLNVVAGDKPGDLIVDFYGWAAQGQPYDKPEFINEHTLELIKPNEKSSDTITIIPGNKSSKAIITPKNGDANTTMLLVTASGVTPTGGLSLLKSKKH